MSPLSRLRLPAEPAELEEPMLRAAVAAIFGPGDELLFIHRAERAGDLWSGHMAFPGGREEPHDPSLRATAVRETQEEIGLDLSEATFVGALSPLAAPRNAPIKRLAVIPYVFRVAEWAPITCNVEVASVVRFPFSRFLAREARGIYAYTWQGVEYDLPCVRLDGTLLWGMTLKMVDELIAHAEAE